METACRYESPLGPMLLAAEEDGLTGAWFVGQKYFAQTLGAQSAEGETPLLKEARRWLDGYFAGEIPGPIPPVRFVGTAFQKAVWALLCAIPYGQTTTYGALAKLLAKAWGKERFSAQAVGGTVGRNPISIFVPCHRVVGANGSLTGYAGGIEKKLALLRLEGADLTGLFVPARGTAL